MHRMHHEYAVEPAAIAKDWDTCRYLAELFGFDRGRLLSEYPRKEWLEKAINSASHLRPVEQKRVTEKLRQLERYASIGHGRDFNPATGTWLDNAVAAHSSHPFRAIVATRTNGHDRVVTTEGIQENHPLFEVSRSREVPLKAETIAGAMAPLIACSRHIIIVDKYYHPSRLGYRETTRELLKTSRNNKKIEEFEFHYCERKPSTVDRKPIIEIKAAEKLVDIVPTGMTIKIVHWREKENGKKFHARYLLTDRGGISVEAGFQSVGTRVGPVGSLGDALVNAGFQSVGTRKSTDMHLLADAFRKERIKNLVPITGTYEHVPPILEIHGDGGVTETDSLPRW